MSVRATRRGLPALLALLALGGATFAALTLGLTGALAATADTQYDVVPVDSPIPQFGAGFGSRLAFGDLTGDGVNDVFVASQGQDVGGVENAGMLTLINGATREVVYNVNNPDTQNNPRFGFEIGVIPDLNGDGVPDLIDGSGNQRVGNNAGQGRLYVFDGATGDLDYHIDHPDPQARARFGDYASAAGDVTGDGLGDIVTGAVSNDSPTGCSIGVPAGTPLPSGCRKEQGKGYVFDGSDGSLVYRFDIPQADQAPPTCSDRSGRGTCGALGFGPRGIGDLNGDGVPDQMFSAGSLRPDGDQTRHGRLYVVSGANGELLTRIDQPAPDTNALWGFNDLARFTPGDLNADGVPEIYGTGLFQDGPNGEPDGGRAWIFDGKASLEAGEGVVLYEFRDPAPTPARGFGFSASNTDFNKDGTTDLYISPSNGQDGQTYIYDGRDGSLLKILALPGPEIQPSQPGNGGTNLLTRAMGDLNGDGEPDFVGSTGGQDVEGTQDQGKLYFFLSNVPGPPAAPAAPAPPASPGAGPCGQPGGAGYLNPAKMRVSRARVLREDRELDVLAPITTRARGADVSVTYQGDERSDTFDAEVTDADSELDEIRIKEEITAGQAELGTGIVNLTYLGDADTRPELVRLRAASQRAELDVDEISLIGDRLSGQGSVTSRAEGVVRLRYSYVDPDGSPNVHLAQAEIDEDGDWELENDQVPAQLAQCGGYLSIQFTGYFERRIRGEQLAYELNAGQTRTP
jgi:hypothetical protein